MAKEGKDISRECPLARNMDSLGVYHDRFLYRSMVGDMSEKGRINAATTEIITWAHYSAQLRHQGPISSLWSLEIQLGMGRRQV